MFGISIQFWGYSASKSLAPQLDFILLLLFLNPVTWGPFPWFLSYPMFSIQEKTEELVWTLFFSMCPLSNTCIYIYIDVHIYKYNSNNNNKKNIYIVNICIFLYLIISIRYKILETWRWQSQSSCPRAASTFCCPDRVQALTRNRARRGHPQRQRQPWDLCNKTD